MLCQEAMAAPWGVVKVDLAAEVEVAMGAAARVLVVPVAQPGGRRE